MLEKQQQIRLVSGRGKCQGNNDSAQCKTLKSRGKFSMPGAHSKPPENTEAET